MAFPDLYESGAKNKVASVFEDLMIKKPFRHHFKEQQFKSIWTASVIKTFMKFRKLQKSSNNEHMNGIVSSRSDLYS